MSSVCGREGGETVRKVISEHGHGILYSGYFSRGIYFDFSVQQTCKLSGCGLLEQLACCI